MNTFQKIYDIVAKIPQGKVLTYKKVAEMAGVKNARVVGFALHANKNPKEIPCHRVIKSDGSLASGYTFGGKTKQLLKLKSEEVVFLNTEIVNLKMSLFNYY